MNKVIHRSYDSDWREEEKFITLIKKSFSHNLIEKYSKFGTTQGQFLFWACLVRHNINRANFIVSLSGLWSWRTYILPNILDLPSYNEKIWLLRV